MSWQVVFAAAQAVGTLSEIKGQQEQAEAGMAKARIERMQYEQNKRMEKIKVLDDQSERLRSMRFTLAANEAVAGSGDVAAGSFGAIQRDVRKSAGRDLSRIRLLGQSRMLQQDVGIAGTNIDEAGWRSQKKWGWIGPVSRAAGNFASYSQIGGPSGGSAPSQYRQK